MCRSLGRACASPSAQPLLVAGALSRVCGVWARVPRFAVEQMSEAPVVTPLTLLGDFVTELGRMPERERVTTFLARLRERVQGPPPMFLASICITMVRLVF